MEPKKKKTIRGSGWKNLHPDRDGFDLLGKNDKKEGQLNTKSKKVRFRSLER